MTQTLRMAIRELERLPAAGLVAMTAVALGLAGLWAGAALGPAVGLGGLALLVAAGVLAILGARQRRNLARWHATSFALVAGDTAAWFATDATGAVVLRNAAAEAMFGTDAQSLTDA